MERPSVDAVGEDLRHASFRTLLGTIAAGLLLLLAITVVGFLLPYVLATAL